MANEAVIKVRSDVGNALKGIDQVGKSLGRMNAMANRGGSGGMGAGNKMMLIGQFADDAQYGLRAVTNQVGQLGQAFGMSSGMAGALLFATVGLNLILSGKAKQWGENIGKLVAGGGELDEEFKRNAESARLMFEEQERGIKMAIKGYEDLADSIENATRVNRELLEIDNATLSNRGARESEQMSRRSALAQAFQSTDRFKKMDLNERLAFEKQLSNMEKDNIRNKRDLELRTADERLDVERRNQELQLRKLREAESVAKLIMDTQNGMDSEEGKKAAESLKAARIEAETIRNRIRVLEIERFGIRSLAEERIKTAEQERQIRLNTLREESMAILQREQDDTNARLADIAGQSVAVGTSLQRVGLGKTPELVMQVDLARKSEQHLAKIARAMERLNLGLN